MCMLVCGKELYSNVIFAYSVVCIVVLIQAALWSERLFCLGRFLNKLEISKWQP